MNFVPPYLGFSYYIVLRVCHIPRFSTPMYYYIFPDLLTRPRDFLIGGDRTPFTNPWNFTAN